MDHLPFAVFGNWKADGRQNFALLDRSFKQAFKEIRSGNIARPVRPVDMNGGIKGQRAGGKFSRRIGVGNRPPDGAAIANGRVGNQVSGAAQQGGGAERSAGLSRPLHGASARQSADGRRHA